MTQAYPLHWPQGFPRTKPEDMQRSKFKITPDKARIELAAEVSRLGATNLILSTNVPVRRDGWPLARAAGGEPRDPGVAAWFLLDGEQRCIPCDRWCNVCDNMHAIALTIDAMRGIERWGSGAMMRRTFQAFAALPPVRTWRVILKLNGPCSVADVEAAYRHLAKTAHPDAGGSDLAMAELNVARDAALMELKA